MIYILYRPGSEHERSVQEFKRRLEERRVDVELISADSREGAAKSRVYEIMQFPTVLALREGNGQLIQTWLGIIPTISDAEFYAQRSI